MRALHRPDGGVPPPLTVVSPPSLPGRSACCTDRMVTELRRKVATEAAAADANASASDASGEARVAIDAVGGAAALGGAPVAFSA